MSLAPTLLKFRTIAIGVGAAAIAGQAPYASNPDIALLTPGRALLSAPAADYFPTVITVAGPYAAPDRSAITLSGQIPFLQRIKVIEPTLPDAEASENDLTPSIVWGSGVTPGIGLVTAGGMIPALTRDSGDYAFPSMSLTPAALVGLAPTVEIPAINQWLKSPRQAPLATAELAPTLVGEMTVSVDSPVVASLVGLVPTFRARYPWLTVELTGEAVWTDVNSAS